VLGAGLDEALGRCGERGVADGGAVASEVDGVHHCEGAADAEGKAEKESDDSAERESHAFDDGMFAESTFGGLRFVAERVSSGPLRGYCARPAWR